MPDASAPADSPSGVSRRDLLLATKLYIPRRRSNLVPRPRLTERLNAGLRRKLTLISAPAGYGKTTLLSEWIPQSERCVAWVSLDEGDNDPARFWAYFVAALQTLRADIGAHASSLLQSRQPVSAEPFVTILVNEIDAFPDSFALVLDDYHVIETQSIHQALAFLLDHLPPRMHLIIASRTDPLLPLAHLRARDEMTELRAEDLSFASDEATTFLNHIMRLNLSTDHVAALAARTEGWIAGLQLAALSMRGSEDQSDFVAAFAGSHRFILDYLSDQVLGQQPATLQSFLLQTSILDRLSAPLCDAVTGRSDGQSTLETLEQRNLFLVPLDSERCWYRYHQLFADVLRHRLQQTQPDAFSELHRRASLWYETEGLLPEAVAHALATRDFEHAAQLIERGVEKLWQRGEIATLTSWMQALPDAVRRARPGVCLAYARVLADMARYTAVEALVIEAEHELEHHPPADNSLAQPACMDRRLPCGPTWLSPGANLTGRLSFHARPSNCSPKMIWRGAVLSP